VQIAVVKPGEAMMRQSVRHWPATPLAKRLGLQWPILLAPMAGTSTPELAAGVAAAGGLGSLGCATQPVDVSHRQIAAFRQISNGGLNVNFFCHERPADIVARSQAARERLAPFYAEAGIGTPPEAAEPFVPFGADHLALVEEFRPDVVSFHFGLPAQDLLNRVRATGATIFCTATTVAEARHLEGQGVDAIVAQGIEAGGHRGVFLDTPLSQHSGLMALLPQIVDAVDVPVIAAGGIADGRGIAAAMMLGAQAVQIGTAFLRCPEAATPAPHRDRLRDAGEGATRLTRLFSGRPARSVVNRLMRELDDSEAEAAPYPAQISLVAPLAKAVAEADRPDVSSIWAGQAVGLGRDMPAAQLTERLAAEADTLMRPANTETDR
jgi:nitronate monooxygenase